jgi:hypothetical protein
MALWVPATSHALLEHAGWIHTSHADEHGASDPDNDHDAADGVCRIASTEVQVPTPDLSSSQLAFLSLSFTFVLLAPKAALPTSNGPDPPAAAPPELSHTWQFSFRASLPSRAPTLAS